MNESMNESIKFLDLLKYSKKLKPVTSPAIFTRTDEFHPKGLFSELIFGPENSKERKSTFSYISLNCKVIHPTALRILTQLDRKVEKFISTQGFFIVDKSGNLVESENGLTGIPDFVKVFPKIKWRGDTKTRESYIELLKRSYKEGTLFINLLPVIPPDQRPAFKDEVTGEWTFDVLNDYYTTVVKRSIDIKSFGREGTLHNLLNYYIQLAINEHNEFIQTKIGKKFGIIRSQLLGKRVEYSGRAVITSGPQLNVDEVGLPMQMAVNLFKPLVMHILLYSPGVDKEKLNTEIKSFTGDPLSTETIERVIKSIKNEDDVPSDLYDIFFEATKLAMSGRAVLVKRDPMLHPEGIRAVKPILVNGIALQMCSLQVGGFNADFDGDQAAVFHPLTNESQSEIQKKMMKAATGNTPTLAFELSKEMCVGLYLLTKPISSTKPPLTVNQEDLNKANDPYIPVMYKGIKTSMGKAIFNNCLPNDFRFIDDQVGKKLGNNLVREINDKYGEVVAKESISRMKNVAFKFATIIAPSVTLNDLRPISEVEELKKQIPGLDLEKQSDLFDKMNEIAKTKLKKSSLGDLVESGSTKGWDQPLQMVVAKGIFADPKGNILPPVTGSFGEGLKPTEYFNAASSARKGMGDRVLNTASTGYTSRQLVFLLNGVECDLRLKDCGTKRTLQLKLTDDIIKRLNGRFIVKNGTVKEFIPSEHKDGDVIQLRTPIYCISPKICHTCYGRLIERHKTPYVGVLAAQIIGERGTQLIMRSFHSSAIKLLKRDIIQDIVDNDPLVDKEKVLKYLHQKENALFSNKECKIIITMSDYDLDDSLEINEEETSVWVKSLISRVEFEDVIFNMILDYPVDLKIKDIVYEGKERIILNYGPDDDILEVPLEKNEIKEQVLYIKRLVGGKEIYKDTPHLLLKLYKVYGPIAGDMDFVHLEILVSQSVRDKDDPSRSARLSKNPDDPEMVNIKRNVFNSGFLSGLAFENVGEAIRTGLITKRKMETSVIEKIMTGTLVVEKKDGY